MVDETPAVPQRRRTSILLNVEDNPSKEDDNEDDKYEKFNKNKQQMQASFAQRAFDSFQHTAAISLTANRVDAVLAAFGCAGTLALLQYLTNRFPTYEVNGSFLTASAIKFFLNESPGSLDACVQSSGIAILFGITLAFAPSYFDSYAREFFMFFMLLYWKLQGCLWGAASALTMAVAVQSGGSWSAVVAHPQDKFPWHFLFFPYISGHLILYALAFVMSLLRRKVRVRLLQREFFVSKHVTNEMKESRLLRRSSLVSGIERRQRLRQLFQRMDTSGDGHLDVLELQVALRAATGNDISREDTQDILNLVDSDGSGTVDFDEFCASIGKLWSGWELE
jgi:EF-hand domain pair